MDATGLQVSITMRAVPCSVKCIVFLLALTESKAAKAQTLASALGVDETCMWKTAGKGVALGLLSRRRERLGRGAETTIQLTPAALSLLASLGA